jgi:hypothetical protein
MGDEVPEGDVVGVEVEEAKEAEEGENCGDFVEDEECRDVGDWGVA